MKKMITIIVLFLSFFTLASCGEKDKEDKNIEITLWHYYSGHQLEAFNKLVSEFNASKGKELGITVKASSEGNVYDLETNVIAAAKKEPNAKAMPNMFLAYSDTAYQLDRMGKVADLKSYFTEKELDEYIDGYIKEGDLSGTGSLKIFPIAKATEIFLINTTDWEKFLNSDLAIANNISLNSLDTIENLIKVAELYYEYTDSLTPDVLYDGKAFFGRDSMANYMLIGAMQLGTEIISIKDGKTQIDLNKEVIKKLWDNYYTPYISGYFAANGKYRSDDIVTNDIIAFVGSSTSATYFPDEVIISDDNKYPIGCEIIEVPQFENAVEGYAVQQGAGMVVTNTNNDEIKASVEFLKWLTKSYNNIEFSVESGYMPVKTAANDFEVIKNYVSDQSLADSLKVSIETVKTNNMYTPNAVKNGQSIRKILEYALIEEAKLYRTKVIEELNNGKTLEEAVTLYNTSDIFENWYNSIKQQIEELAG